MIDLNPLHIETVNTILTEYVPECEVWAFGSRATWTAKDYSDLDLAVVGKEPLDWKALSRLKEAFEGSNLPMRVDVLDWHSISESFRNVIKRDFVVIQRRGKQIKTGDWRKVTLGEFAPFTYGKSLPMRQRNASGQVPVFGSNGIVGYHDTVLTDGPSIIIGRKGTAGAVHYSPVPCWPIDTTFFVTDDDTELARFKYYALCTLGLDDMNTDSAVPGLNRNAAHARELRLPDEAEQRRIAHILGTLDDKIELNRRMNVTLEDMARALFKSWFVDFEPVYAKMEGRWRRGESLPGMPADLYDSFPNKLVPSEIGEIPEEWEIKTMGDLCTKPQYGYTASAQNEPVGPHFLRITDINKQAWVEWASVPFCEITDDNYQKYRLEKGDILIARMAAPGHGIMVEEDHGAVFASYLIRFRLKAGCHQRFIQYWLRSPDYWRLVSARSAGTTRASLNAKVISGFPLIVPPYDIAKEFGNRVDDLRNRVVANTTEARALTSLRDLLLHSLFSGNLQAV